jgi:putative aldouronate transport system substrate-binding protein
MKKTLAVLVILIMTSALVFAAGGNQQPSAGAAGTPARITVELFDRGTDGGRTRVDNNAWTDWIKEKVKKDLNIEVTFFPVGRWQEDTILPTLMASGSAPDLCYTYSGAAVNNFRDQGGLVDLVPFVNSLLPDAKKLLGADPALTGKDFIMRNLITTGANAGKMFSINSYRVALAIRNIFIRKDWLDTLGLPVPTTTQQFYQALVAFRDRDPGNVGRNNVVPLLLDSPRWGGASFMNPSITPNMSDRDRYIYGGISRANVAFPGFKEGVRMINQWFNEGLIFRDFPLLAGEDANNMIKTGFVGSFAANWDVPYRGDSKILEDLRRNVPNADLVPVDAIRDANGVTVKDSFDKAGLQIFVPASSRNREAALRYLNWLCIKENYNFLQFGQQGVNHRLVNGVPEIIVRPPNDPWFQNSALNIDFTMPMNGAEMGSDEMNARVLALSYGGFPADVIVNAYQISMRNARAPVVVNMPTTQDGIFGQVMIDKVDALLAQAITANPANFDNVWDAGLRDIMTSGGQQIMDERRTIANSFFR